MCLRKKNPKHSNSLKPFYLPDINCLPETYTDKDQINGGNSFYGLWSSEGCHKKMEGLQEVRKNERFPARGKTKKTVPWKYALCHAPRPRPEHKT